MTHVHGWRRLPLDSGQGVAYECGCGFWKRYCWWTPARRPLAEMDNYLALLSDGGTFEGEA